MIKHLLFWYYFAVARCRGIGRTYNKLPKGNSCSTGIYKVNEAKIMFFRHGWKPYCITKKSGSFLCD